MCGLLIARQRNEQDNTRQIRVACTAHNSVRCPLVMTVDPHWFANRIADRGLSQRKLAKLMGLDPSALSLAFRGKRAVTVDEAAQIAVLLRSTTREVLEALGVQISGVQPIKVAGILDANGTVNLVAEGLHDTVEAPPGIPADALAIQARTREINDGWLYFVGAEHGPPEAAVGHLSLVAVRDNGLKLAHVSRGYRRGAFNLTVGQGDPQSYELAWATPVLWIKTTP